MATDGRPRPPGVRVSFVKDLLSDTHRGGEVRDIDVQSTVTTDESLSSFSSFPFQKSWAGSAKSEATSQAVIETPSVAKSMTRLLSLPSNRKCADCRAHMVDSSQTVISFSPTLGKLPLSAKSHPNRGGIGVFQFNHQAFAPPTVTSSLCKSDIDPALYVTELVGGHSVFICKECAEAHEVMGETVTVVKSVQDFSAFTLDQVRFFERCGGNNKSWTVYEAFMPDCWKKRIPSSKSALPDRLTFCLAKYDALAFVMPTGGGTAERAWRTLLQRDKSLERFRSGLSSISKLTLSDTASSKSLDLSVTDTRMPDRFVDFFCVVGHRKKLYPGEARKDLYAIDSPEGLALESVITDCYPEQDAYPDMEFPEHISQFVFPDGCYASETQLPPTLFTFVLTSANGHRLYGAALRIYDETMETSQMKDVLEASGYTVPLPWWLQSDPSPPNMKGGEPNRQPSDIVFLPKCLVVVSHYSFFHAYRQFLKQLYRISILESPLPIERYIANFTAELPLPPQGKVEVKFGFSSDVHCSISRPAPNELPLARFSYRPLFMSLSVSNIMVIVACLSQETSVALVSKNYGLLTPCAEALLSFLFPLEWQGIYLPVMPYSTIDILDAPVPFLVGLNSRYLSNVKPKRRPKGVVFVDLDRDIVHLGYDQDDNGFDYSNKLCPSLPEKDAAKLRKKLIEFGSSVYLLPMNGIKGLITYGEGDCLENRMREPYAYMETLNPGSEEAEVRKQILTDSDIAFPDNKDLKPINGFFSEEGQLSSNKEDTRPSVESPSKSRVLTNKLLSKMDRRQTQEKDVSRQVISKDIHDVEEHVDRFNVAEIRQAFLRYFTAMFNNYESFASNKFESELFRSEDFLNEKNYPPATRQWMSSVLNTQMFQHFLEERIEDRHGAMVLMFDESIVAKNNRSMKKKMKQGRLTTPFLHDQSWKISESFTPPAPSNWGLPADGRMYSYSKFPKLNPSLFGAVRPRKQWPPEWEQKIQRKGASRITLLRRKEMLQKALVPTVRGALISTLSTTRGGTVPRLLATLPKASNRDISWALATIAQGCLENQCDDEASGSKTLISRLRSASRHGNTAIDAEDASTNDSTSGDLLVAQDIILACRRKQGILIARIAKFQLSTRKGIRRTQFESYTEELKQKHAGLDYSLRQVVLVQSCARKFLATLKKKKRRRASRLIQRSFSIIMHRRAEQRSQAATRIQMWVRRDLARIKIKRMKFLIVVNQAAYRGHKARIAYGLVRKEVIKTQALLRGYLIRIRVRRLLGRQLSRYVEQVFLLWKRDSTPLSYRSQMWPLFLPTFMGCRIIMDELKRLWDDVQIKYPKKTKNNYLNDDVITDMSAIGFSIKFEVSFLRVRDEIFSAQSRYPADTVWFPGEDTRRAHQHSKRLDLERVQIYERLSSLEKTTTPLKIYGMFGIESTDKKKKVRLLEILWNDVGKADESVKAIIILFPELQGGIDIKEVRASKKGLSRLRVHKHEPSLLEPLDKVFWVDHKMDKLYRANMAEVAVSSMSSTNASRALKLKDRRSLLKSTSLEARLEARLLNDHQGSNWMKCKRAIMRHYLYGEMKIRPKVCVVQRLPSRNSQSESTAVEVVLWD